MIKQENLYQYIGTVHIHTTYSDGSKPIDQVIKIGQRVGLDFLLFTDHMTLQPLQDGKEGWYDQVLVLIGYEINDRNDHNHYLAFNLEQVLSRDLKPEEYVQQVREKGGLGIIAHPDEVRTQLPEYRPYPWNAWEVDGYDGIEIWNQMSEWMERLRRWNKIKMVLSPRRSLYGPTARILAHWDNVNQTRPVVGIGGIDVHAHPYKVIGPLYIVIFPYEVQFKSLRTHILLREPLSPDFQTAKSQFLSALRHCQVFISNYRWGDASGFQFRAESSKTLVTIGETITAQNQITLLACVPQACHLKLVHNGKVVKKNTGKELFYQTREKGVYRIEAFWKNRGWIYSNHIRIK